LKFYCITPNSLLLILVCWFSEPVYADSANEQPITIVTEHWAPYVFADDKGVVKGSMTDRVKAIVDRSGLTYTISLYPWPRSYKIAQTKPNVLIYPIYQTPEREGLFHFICPFSEKIDLYLFKLASRDDIKLTALEEAKQYRIGLIRDDFDHDLLIKAGFEIGKQLDVNVDDNGSIKKLLKGRVDLMTQSLSGMKRLLKEHNLEPGKLIPALHIKIDDTLSCLAMSLATPQATVDKVSKAMKHINNTQAMLKLE
jgi:polar amino acid transport system substrate-binding protein